MFNLENIIKSLLPADFDIGASIALMQKLAQDFADVKSAVVRIEGLLLATPVPFTDSTPAPVALTQPGSATVTDATPPANDQIVTSLAATGTIDPAPLSPLEVQSAQAVQSVQAANADISPEVLAMLVDAAQGQASLPVQAVGNPPTTPIWGVQSVGLAQGAA